MTPNIRSPLVLLVLGAIALVGLIVLAGTDNLHDPTVRDTLTSLAVGSLTGAAAVTTSPHTHPPRPSGGAATVTGLTTFGASVTPPAPGSPSAGVTSTDEAGAGPLLPPGA